MPQLEKEQQVSLGLAQATPDLQKTQDRLDATRNQSRSDKEGLRAEVQRLGAQFQALQEQIADVTPEQLASDAELRANLIDGSQKLDDTALDLAEAERALALASSLERFLGKLERNPELRAAPEKLSALLDGLERDPTFRPAAFEQRLPPASSAAFDQLEVRVVLNLVDFFLRSGGSGGLEDARATLDARDDLAARSPDVAAVRDALSTDLPKARDAALEMLDEIALVHPFDIQSLGNQTIAEIPEFLAAWNEFVTSNDYDTARIQFWRSLHPDGPNAASQTSVFARDRLATAGYNFDNVRPGAAPRMISATGLPRNEGILSVQHDFPQHLSKHPELAQLTVSPANLRFATISDNVLEDRKYYLGPCAQESQRLQRELDTAQRIARQVGKDPRLEASAREKLAGVQAQGFKEMQDRALKATGVGGRALSELDKASRINQRLLQEAQTSYEAPGLSEADRTTALLRLQKAEQQLEKHLERASHAALLVSRAVGQATAAVKERLRELSAEETPEQREARIRMEVEMNRHRRSRGRS